MGVRTIWGARTVTGARESGNLSEGRKRRALPAPARGEMCRPDPLQDTGRSFRKS
eukprot:gene2720-2758_t